MEADAFVGEVGLGVLGGREAKGIWEEPGRLAGEGGHALCASGEVLGTPLEG